MYLPLLLSGGLLVLAVNPIPQVLNTIANDTITLNTTLATYTGDSDGLSTILDEANTLQDDIKSGGSTAQGAPALTFQDALGLAQTAAFLYRDTNNTISSLIAAKNKLAKYQVNSIVKSILENMKNETDVLSTNVIDKVPLELQPVAQQLVGEIVAQFAGGIQAYSD